MESNRTRPNRESSKKYISLSQIKKMIDPVRDMRDKLLIKILYETGCSLTELVYIKVADIQKNKIKISDKESKKFRYSRISQKLYSDIMNYVKGNNLSNDSFVLSTKKSQRISEKRVRQLVQYYAIKAGLGKINPQMFRYYHIMHSYENGVFIENIAEQLGIKRFRIFQILTEQKINIKKDFYENFLNKLEENK
jgi:site-specific recombinase XerD